MTRITQLKEEIAQAENAIGVLQTQMSARQDELLTETQLQTELKDLEATIEGPVYHYLAG